MSKRMRVACIGAGRSGTGHMIIMERFRPGCCVAFSDISRDLFDEIISG